MMLSHFLRNARCTQQHNSDAARNQDPARPDSEAGNTGGTFRRSFAPALLLLCFLPLSVAWAGESPAGEDRPGGRPGVTPRGAMLGTVSALVLEAESREPLPGASVFLIGTKFGASTAEDGKCDITNLPPGTYTLATTAIGYRLAAQQEITVRPGEPVELVVLMEEAGVELDGVEITSPPFPRKTDAPLSAFDQSREEVRRLPGGFEDVVRAAGVLPGIAQLQTGRNDLIVRGGAPAENLFFLDDLEMPSLNHFGTQGSGGGPLSFINLDLVEGTSFSSGGFGVRHGDKLSAVMSVDLREGRRDRMGGKAVLSLTQFGLIGEGPLGNGGSALVSVRRSYLDPIVKAAGLSYVPEFWDVIAKAGYDLGANDHLSLLGVAIFDKMKPFYNTPTQTYDNAYILHSNQRQWAGGLTWRHRMGKGFMDLSVAQTVSEYNYLQHDVQRKPVFTNDAVEYSTAVRADAALQALGGEFSFGGQVKFLRMDAAIYLRALATTFGSKVSAQAEADLRGVRSSAYIQAAHTLWIFRLQGGLRMDHANLILENPFVFSPRVSLTALAAPGIELTLLAGKYAQTPLLVWIAANPVNRNLPYMRADHLVGGVSYLAARDLMVRVEGYIKQYHDYPASTTRTYLTLSNTGAGFGGLSEGFASFGVDPLVGEGEGRSRGVELSIQKKPSAAPVYGIMSITLSEALYAGLDGMMRSGSYDQRWIGNLGAGWHIDEVWTLSARARFFTGRPYTPFTPQGRQYAALFNTMRVRTHHQIDVRIDRRWDLGSVGITAFLDVQNIYNRIPEEVPFFNNRTRQIDRVKALGILPSIGVNVEF